MRTFVRLTVVFGWLVTLSCSAFALSLGDIQKELSGADVISARFEMIKRSQAVGVPLLSHGRVVLVRDKGLLWTMTDPFAETLGFSEKKRGRTDDLGHWQVEENKTLGIVTETMDKVLKGDFAFLSDRFFIEIDGSKENWRVLATPKAGNAKEWISEVLVTGARHISRVQIVMKNATVTEIVFEDAKDNPEINEEDRRLLESLQ